MSIGIYSIVNTRNSKMYFGQSVHLEKRIQSHRCALFSKAHRNHHLQSAWNEQEGNGFVFAIVETCSIADLDSKERYYIGQYNADNPAFGYNFTNGGESKHKHSLESRKKMSETHLGKSSGRKGKKATPEQIEKNRITHLGKHQSEETKRKLSEMFKGRLGISHPVSEETRKKISESAKGRKHTEESRKRMCIAQQARNYVPTYETIQKIRQALIGKKQSAGQVKNRSISLTGKKRKNSTSKYIGVCWKERDKRWLSRIRHNFKDVVIGWYKSEIEAAKAYNKKATEIYGNEAKLNRIPENE